jgi:hypothetical protein
MRPAQILADVKALDKSVAQAAGQLDAADKGPKLQGECGPLRAGTCGAAAL